MSTEGVNRDVKTEYYGYHFWKRYVFSRRPKIGSDGAVATSSYWPCISDLSGLLAQGLGEGEGDEYPVYVPAWTVSSFSCG